MQPNSLCFRIVRLGLICQSAFEDGPFSRLGKLFYCKQLLRQNDNSKQKLLYFAIEALVFLHPPISHQNFNTPIPLSGSIMSGAFDMIPSFFPWRGDSLWNYCKAFQHPNCLPKRWDEWLFYRRYSDIFRRCKDVSNADL